MTEKLWVSKTQDATCREENSLKPRHYFKKMVVRLLLLTSREGRTCAFNPLKADQANFTDSLYFLPSTQIEPSS